MAAASTPQRADVVWLTYDPQAGPEQAGCRPAVVVSPGRYNEKVGLALFCPITTRVKGYPYEVIVPQGLPVGGVILSDQLKSLDWRARHAQFVVRLPEAPMAEVLAKIRTLTA